MVDVVSYVRSFIPFEECSASVDKCISHRPPNLGIALLNSPRRGTDLYSCGHYTIIVSLIQLYFKFDT